VPTRNRLSSSGFTLYISLRSAGKNPVANIACSLTRTGGMMGRNPLLTSFWMTNCMSANSRRAASFLR